MGIRSSARGWGCGSDRLGVGVATKSDNTKQSSKLKWEAESARDRTI